MGEKTAGVGHYAIPTAPIRGVTVTSGTTNAFGSYAQIVASTSEAIFIEGFWIAEIQTGQSYYAVQIGVGGAGSESIVEIKYANVDNANGADFRYMSIIPPIPVAASSRIAVATAVDGGVAKTCKITLDVIAQSNVVDDGVAGTATISGTVAANMTQVNGHSVTDTANGVLDVNAKNHGGTAQTGRDIGASVLLAADQAVNTTKLGGTTVTARDIGASVLLSSGTGTGQLDFTSGVVKANLAQILGTALTETAGQIAAAFKKFFNIASPAATMDHGVLVDTATTVTNRVTANSDQWAGTTIPAPAVTGEPKVDINHVFGQSSPIDSGTAQSATSTNLRLRASAPGTDVISNRWILITSATTGGGQFGFCSAYNTSTKDATVDGWSQGVTPTGTIKYAVIGF